MRIVFMGTPDFAVPALKILLDHGHEVVGVITATDKYGGRGGKQLIESAVKRFATSAGLPVLQPKNLKAPAFLDQLRAWRADLQIVVAFRMLPVVVWDMPPLGTVNLHGSVLPKYRGAAPINWAIINGEKETGVSTFFLQHAIDTGDLLFVEKVPIQPNDTAGTVHDKLMMTGATLILKTVNAIASGDYQTTPQDASLVSKAPKIFHDTCAINWDQPTQYVYNFIRGLSPYPAAWTELEGKNLKIYEARPEVIEHDDRPGRMLTDQKTYLKFTTRDGLIDIQVLKLAGKRRMSVVDFLNGYKFSA